MKSIPRGSKTWLIKLCDPRLFKSDEEYYTYVTAFVDTKEEAIYEAYYSMTDIKKPIDQDNIDEANRIYKLVSVKEI